MREVYLKKENKKGRPKISDEIKKVIIKLHNSNLGVRKISNQLDVSKSSVHRVIAEFKSNPTPLDQATKATVPVAPSAVTATTQTSLFKNIPHSHQIDDAMIEQMKSEFGYPNISYYKLMVGHQKKCRCYACSIIRKKNWLQLKKWADINVTRSEDNE